MRNESHTWIGTIRNHLEAWRKAHGWSRETMVMQIVEAHVRIGGPAATGIVFDPDTRDAFERAKVNADRVYRWLDDATKDSTLLPMNFMPAILHALPMERRVALVNDMLLGAGMVTRALPATDSSDSTVSLFKSLVSSGSNANQAMADLLDGVDPGELERAHVTLGVVRCVAEQALAQVEAELAGGRK